MFVLFVLFQITKYQIIPDSIGNELFIKYIKSNQVKYFEAIMYRYTIDENILLTEHILKSHFYKTFTVTVLK